MTTAQKALIKIAKSDNVFLASVTIEAIARYCRAVSDSPETAKEQAALISEKTNGMLDGETWVAAMVEAMSIANN